MPTSPTSRPTKTASLTRVALVLLLFFGALEAFTRLKLVEMSKDLRRLRAYPSRASTLHQSRKLRVAVLGNSATQAGIDDRMLQSGLRARGIVAATELFTADASHLNTWQPIANHLFWSPRQAPDVLVVPFFNRSLEDGNNLEIGRLAQFFTSPDEMPRALSELPDTASKLDFAASSVWATYATRARLKERVLKAMVPDYEAFTTQLHAAAPPSTAPRSEPTYRHLERLGRDAKASGCRLIFVALPWRDTPYRLEAALRAQVRAAGAQLLDLRRLPGFRPAVFADSIHLNAQGRDRLMPPLLDALAPLLRVSSPPNRAVFPTHRDRK